MTREELTRKIAKRVNELEKYIPLIISIIGLVIQIILLIIRPSH